MENQLEYELIDIEWKINYDTPQDSRQIVCEGNNPPVKEELILDEDGVPISGPDAERVRRRLIFEFIKKWHENHPDARVFNTDLNEYVIINHSFLDEATTHSAKSYKSTKAVLIFEQAIKNATKYAVTKTKEGDKNQAKFQEMLVLTYHCDDLGTIKLTVGVRFRSHDKVQYAISVPKEGQPIVDAKLLKRNNCNNKKKASHKK